MLRPLFHVLVLLTALTGLLADPQQPDPIAQEIDKAKAIYKEGLKGAKEQLLKRFDQRLKEAAGKANVELVKELTDERKVFADEDSLPRSQVLRTDLSDFFRSITTATKKLEDTFDDAIKKQLKAGEVAKAEAITQEWDTFLEECKVGEVRLASLTPTDGCRVQALSGAIALTPFKPNPHVRTKRQYSPPFLMRALAKTNSTNIRLYYAKGVAIFNWEVKPTELRVTDPADGGLVSIPGKGQVRPNQFHEIIWEVDTARLRLFVNGNLVCEKTGEYLDLSSELGIGADAKSVVTVSSFAVWPLRKDR